MYDVKELDEIAIGDRILFIAINGSPQIGTVTRISLSDQSLIVKETPFDLYFEGGQVAVVE